MDFVKYHGGDGNKMEYEERRFPHVTIPSDGHLFVSRGISLARSRYLRRTEFEPGISQVPPFCEMCFPSLPHLSTPCPSSPRPPSPFLARPPSTTASGPVSTFSTVLSDPRHCRPQCPSPSSPSHHGATISRRTVIDYSDSGNDIGQDTINVHFRHFDPCRTPLLIGREPVT